MVAIVGVHVGHLTQVPHFEGSVFGHCVELVVLSVEADASDGVSVAHEALHLHLVVNVPHAHHSILAARDQVFAVG